MGKLYDELTPKLTQFISEQKLFFVGTAPLSQRGHVNISPKGMVTAREAPRPAKAMMSSQTTSLQARTHRPHRKQALGCSFRRGCRNLGSSTP